MHLLCTYTAFFLYLTSFCIMSFLDFPLPDAKNSINISWDSRPDTQLDQVMCFGTFDIFHPGHVFYLSEAEKYGKRMTVVIARDHRVSSGKWRDPIHNETERQRNVQKSFPEATVMLGNETDIFAPIREMKPDILAFGYDQKVPEDTIHELFPDIKIVRIWWYETDKWKSSLLRK